MRYITVVTQLIPLLMQRKFKRCSIYFAVKQDVPAYISHNVGAIRYIIAHEDNQLTTFAIEPIKLSLNSNIDSAIP